MSEPTPPAGEGAPPSLTAMETLARNHIADRNPTIALLARGVLTLVALSRELSGSLDEENAQRRGAALRERAAVVRFLRRAPHLSPPAQAVLRGVAADIEAGEHLP